jgi:hypothetical protein
MDGRRRRYLLVLGAVLALAAGALGIALGTRGSSPPQLEAPTVQPIGRGVTPQQQARNLSAWLQRYSR